MELPKHILTLVCTSLAIALLAMHGAAAESESVAVEVAAKISADPASMHEASAGLDSGGMEMEPEDHGPQGNVLGLAEALAQALENHPGLQALDKEYWALDSIAWQEGRKPNPELELEFGEFGGQADAREFRALATTLTYTQPIERGGKRTKREIAASLEREVVLWDIAELEHQIQAGVREAYAEAQAAQFAWRQLEDYRALLQRIYDTVAVSVEAGRSARLELERFDIELARLDLEIAMAGRESLQAYQSLAAAMGHVDVGFDSVTEAGAGVGAIPSIEELAGLIEEHPIVGRYSSEYEALCALVDLENANGVPDMSLFGGVTRLNETEETVFQVGVAWDLAVNDRNEGGISAAGYRLDQVADNRAAASLGLETQLATLYQQILLARENYSAYGESLLPAANEALALTEEGYRYGKFSLLDVLDAQRTVLELETEQTQSLMEFHLRVAAVEALLNTSFASFGLHTADDDEGRVQTGSAMEENHE